MSENTKNDLSLEECFQNLEQVITHMGDSNITLEDAFSSYSRGMDLLKQCNEQIDRVEKKVRILSGEKEDDTESV